MPCPRCGTATAFAPENRWRPFCSERCKLQDLGAWANEEYRVPAPLATNADALEPPPEDERG